MSCEGTMTGGHAFNLSSCEDVNVRCKWVLVPCISRDGLILCAQETVAMNNCV